MVGPSFCIDWNNGGRICASSRSRNYSFGLDLVVKERNLLSDLDSAESDKNPIGQYGEAPIWVLQDCMRSNRPDSGWLGVGGGVLPTN